MSTDLKSWDYALQFAYSHFCTKLTSTGSYVEAKLGVGANPHFLWGTYKSTVLFRAQLTTKTPIHHRSTIETMFDGLRIIGRWPPEPSSTIADASPRLRCPQGLWFCGRADETASAAARRWGDGGLGLLFSTRCAREGGPVKQLAPNPFESIKWEIEREGIDWGTQQSTGLRETEGGTQQLFRFRARVQFEAIDSLSCPQTQQ